MRCEVRHEFPSLSLAPSGTSAYVYVPAHVGAGCGAASWTSCFSSPGNDCCCGYRYSHAESLRRRSGQAAKGIPQLRCEYRGCRQGWSGSLCRLAATKKLNAWWKVSAWPEASQQALLGIQAQSALHPGQGLDLTFQGRTLHVSPSGTLQTGADEDSRIYI